MEKFDHEKRGARDAAENFFVVTDLVSPLQKQLLEQKVLLSNMPAESKDRANSKDQAKLDREMQVLHVLEHLVEAEKQQQQQQPHYAVGRLIAVDTAPGSILSLGGKIEAGDSADEQPGKVIALARDLGRVFDLGAPFADLLEERTSKAAEAGTFAAQWWYLKQVLKSVPPMLMRVGRNIAKRLFPSVLEGLNRSIIETIVIDVLATLIAASLLGLIRHIVR